MPKAKYYSSERVIAKSILLIWLRWMYQLYKGPTKLWLRSNQLMKADCSEESGISLIMFKQ